VEGADGVVQETEEVVVIAADAKDVKGGALDGVQDAQVKISDTNGQIRTAGQVSEAGASRKESPRLSPLLSMRAAASIPVARSRCERRVV